jgi:threonine dehydrogenase-like Zn-dependent dehydrogenase
MCDILICDVLCGGRTFAVIGAGVIGIEYASMINVLPGTKYAHTPLQSHMLSTAQMKAQGLRRVSVSTHNSSVLHLSFSTD